MSLVLTLMQNLRAKYAPGTLDKLEIRRSRYGAWDFFKEQTALSTGIITPEVKALIKQSMGNTVQVPVLDAEDVVITNVRACTVPDSENTSKLVTLTFVTYAFGFTMVPAQYKNNDVGYQADFDRKLEKYLIKFADTLDTASVNVLSTKKNTYYPAAITTPYYPVVGNALQVTQAQKNDLFNNADAIMKTADLYGGVNVIASTTLKPIINRLSAQGAGNSVNEDFQFNGYQWNFTNRLTNGTGIQATAYLVQDGMVGVENRNDPDAIMGSRVGDIKIWGEVQMPLVNLKMASYYYEDCADKSALHAGTAHLTRTKVEGYEWSTDVCFVTAYNSSPSTRYSPIMKVEVSAT